MGWLIRGHAPRGVTAPPPPCTPWDTARWRHRWAAGSPGYRPFVPRMPHLVGTGESERLAWAAQPPAPRVAAGSGAGCRAGGGGGGGAAPSGGGRLQLTIAGGRAPGGRSFVPSVGGRHSPRPGRVAVVPNIRIRCARGPHTRWRCPPPAGAPGGIPSPPWASVSAVKYTPRRLHAPLRSPPPHLSQQGSTWCGHGWTSGPGSSGLEVPHPLSRSRVCVLQCASRDDWRCAQSMHEFSAKDIDGRMVNLDKYRWVPTCLVGEAEGGSATLTTPIPPPGASCASSPTWPRNEAKQT